MAISHEADFWLAGSQCSNFRIAAITGGLFTNTEPQISA
jgi:hypothetical protein